MCYDMDNALSLLENLKISDLNISPELLDDVNIDNDPDPE